MSTDSKESAGAAAVTATETSGAAGRAEATTITLEQMQAEVDRRVNQTLDKERKKLEAEQANREKALLAEQGKFQELAETTRKEAEEAKAKLAGYERKQHLDKLLNDKAEKVALLKEPAVRELFHSLNGELPDILAKADGLEKTFSQALEAEVSRRLSTSPPPKTEAPKDAGSLIEQIRTAEAKGDWGTSLLLKTKLEEERRKAIPSG